MTSRSFVSFRLQETGLLLVIIVLAVILGLFGGSVERPRFELDSQGERQRVFTTDAQGERVLAKEKVNKFFNAENLAQLAKDTSFIAIMAVGMTFVIVAGQIDLSVGSIYALAGIVGASILHRYGADGPIPSAQVWGSFLGIAGCCLTAVAAGVVNGLMIVALGVHPFIITLGTMAVYRGIGFVITQGQSIGSFPAVFRHWIKQETSSGLTLRPLIAMVLVAMLGALILGKLKIGRQVYAIGGNELASRFSGIQVGRVKLWVFLISGLTAGIASVLSLGYYGSASSGDGQGYELNVIAAAVVGGASLSGGRGSAWGAILGALIIQMIASGIVILGIDQNYSQIIIGGVVILAVVLDQLNSKWAQNRLRANLSVE